MSGENEFGFAEIPNEELTEAQLPSPDSEFWGDIAEFALTYDAYVHLGSFEKCAEIANPAVDRFKATGQLTDTLDELRACLFFEQRRWHHFGTEPQAEDLVYIHALVEAIREKVKA